MTLDQLPLDILLRIIHFVPSNRDIAALSTQCQVLHDLCDLPTRRKYRRVRLSSDENHETAFHMLLSILRRPHLGTYVRHLEIDRPPPAHRKYRARPYQRCLEPDDLQRLRAATRRAGFVDEREEYVMNMLMQEDPQDDSEFNLCSAKDMRRCFMSQAVAALSIAVCPNIESLAMSPTFYNFTGFYQPELQERWNITLVDFPLDTLLRRTNADPTASPFLQNLQTVRFINNVDSVGADERYYQDFDLLGCMALYHRLPSIETIKVEVMKQDENGKDGFEPNSSNISRICIHHSNLSAMFLATVLCSCKTLREFRYSIGGRGSSDGTTAYFNPKTFIKTILGHKDTLEILDIDAEAEMYELTDDWQSDQSDPVSDDEEEAEDSWTGAPPASLWRQSGSLRDFAAMRRLSVGVYFLFYFANGVNMPDGDEKEFSLIDSLPPDLEYLCIRGYQMWENGMHDRQLAALKAEMATKRPLLKQIEGIDEYIPNAETVSHPDEDLSFMEEPEEWSDYEFS